MYVCVCISKCNFIKEIVYTQSNIQRQDIIVLFLIALFLGMRENGEGSKKWFAVNSKSFKILVEGEGSKQKGFITERRKGFVSWIRFGEVGLKNLLVGVETICKEESKVKQVFEWRENGVLTSWRIARMRRDVSSSAQLQMAMGKGTRFSSHKGRDSQSLESWG